SQVTLRSEFDFSTTAHLSFRWILDTPEGSEETGELEVPELAPGAEHTVSLAEVFPQWDEQWTAPQYLRIEAVLREDQPWAEAGHVVARAQFPLPIAEDVADAAATDVADAGTAAETAGGDTDTELSQPEAEGGV